MEHTRLCNLGVTALSLSVLSLNWYMQLQDLILSSRMGTLSEISEDRITELVTMLENDIPNSIHACHFLKCIQQWKRTNYAVDSHVWCPDGDFSDATFVLRVHLGGLPCYTMYSNSENGCRRLESALYSADSNLISWNRPFLFTCLPKDMAEIIEKILTEKLGEQKFHSNPGHVLWLPKEEAAEMKNTSLPDDVYISKLKPSDGQCINDVWPHRYPGSQKVIEDLIQHNGGYGVYSREGTGQLLSWGLNWFYGGLGIVQTAEGAQRRGYASAIVAQVSRYMAQEFGYHVHANIVWDNKPSLALFEKLGFRHVCTSYWISPPY